MLNDCIYVSLILNEKTRRFVEKTVKITSVSSILIRQHYALIYNFDVRFVEICLVFSDFSENWLELITLNKKLFSSQWSKCLVSASHASGRRIGPHQGPHLRPNKNFLFLFFFFFFFLFFNLVVLFFFCFFFLFFCCFFLIIRLLE